MIISFRIPDGPAFCRYRTRAGFREGGQFVVTDKPGERTGAPGKWYMYDGQAWDLPSSSDVGQAVCGRVLHGGAGGAH